jgi:uncharacterized protein (TIGR03437 family)
MTNSPFTDAYLLLDDPAPANQVVAPVSVSSVSSFSGTLQGTGAGINYGAGGVPNVFLGSLSNINSLTWMGVPLDAPGNGKVVTARITNVRANAAQLGLSSTTVPNQIIALISSSSGLNISNPQQTVAYIQRGLNVSVKTGTKKHDKPYNYPFPGAAGDVSATVNLREGFGQVLKPPAAVPQNLPGFAYNTEGGATFGTDPFQPSPGTHVTLNFGNVPAGVDLFVPVQPSNPAGQLQLNMSGTSSAGGFSQLPVTAGSATAVFEVTSRTDVAAGNWGIPVYVSYNSGGTLATAPQAPTNISVLAGIGTPPASTGAPAIPRFAPPAAPAYPMFTINSATGLTPRLFGSVDSRPCIPAPVFNYYGNSCAPGDAPRVSVTTDSDPLTPLGSATATGGITLGLMPDGTTGPFTGASPLNGTIQVDASKASPGTFQSSLNFTATGAANSLTLPFTVSVLPSTNPILTPSGFDDALTYQSGSVAPGQVFTAFPQNFGPATGIISATVDSSGKIGTSLGGAQLTFDGVGAPLLYITKNQLAGVAPFGLAGKSSTTVQLTYNGVKSPPISLPVINSSISINSADSSGGGPGVILNPDLTLNSPSNPAKVGDTVIMYATYAGPLTVPGTDGRNTIGSPYPAPTGPTSVVFGGVPATNIAYFGNAPTFLESVLQINATIPPGVKPSTRIPVVISAGGATSPATCTIAVK